MEAMHQTLESRLGSYNNVRGLKVATASICAAGALAWCVQDYRAFMALGPGGGPHNVFGWAVITFLIRPFALSKANATNTSDYPADKAHTEIAALPDRKGPRARAEGIAPHRQFSQLPPEQMRPRIQNLFTNLVAQNPALLQTKLSLYERYHDAVFIANSLYDHSNPEKAAKSLPETSKTSRGEICHMHGDMSVHVYLSPADARRVIEKGWGERHRMSVPKTSRVRNMFHIADTYLMFYGPRNEEELEVLKVILRNSVRFMTGVDEVHGPDNEPII